ncbi:hypothetical protein ACIBF1_44115 [Spirillospora sp. NPDC050679]
MTVVLFNDGELGRALESTLAAATKRLMDWDAEALLQAAEHDVVEVLLEQAAVTCPTLLRDEVYMLEAGETDLQYSEFGDQVVRRVPQFTLVVPYTGERQVFLLRASARQLLHLEVAQLGQHDLHIAVAGRAENAEQLRQRFDEQLERINMHLRWARHDIAGYTARIQAEIPARIAQRRADLLAARQLQAGIGYPMRRRADAGAYSVPVTRRQIRPVRSAQSAQQPFAPEPVLADADYEAALEVLRNQRSALERTPALAADMDEERIRDLLLLGLNAQFQGAAAGEVFNGAGKTDILIREDDRNVFIGECKIWDGPKTIDEALNQLLGYLVWRDTKAALLIFIRNKNVTAVIDKAVERIEAHPNYKRRGAHDGQERLDFVLHASGDTDREIRLAFLPFALPGDATSRFAR